MEMAVRENARDTYERVELAPQRTSGKNYRRPRPYYKPPISSVRTHPEPNGDGTNHPATKIGAVGIIEACVSSKQKEADEAHADEISS